jgi:hypothetical protein
VVLRGMPRQQSQSLGEDVVVSSAPGEEAVNLKDRIEVFDRDSKLLDEITSSYPRESAQYQVLRRAQRALWCVLRAGHGDFQNCVEIAGMDLASQSKKQH